jgi:sugar (pentulose or hexulose) kinase
VTTRDHILAIDNGTQSIRALVFDPRGNLIARHKVDLDPYYSVAPGWAEQDPEYYWRSLIEACRGLWAAMAAAVGLGIHPDFATAVDEMTRVRDTFDPDPTTSRIYNRLYQEVYLKMYRRLRPLYERIRDITGYPPKAG